MQSKQTQRLAHRIRKARECKDRQGNLTPWRVVCLKVKPTIIKVNGDPDTGLASRIAYDNYEPGLDIQKRLGLREICTRCHRPFRKKVVREKVIPSRGRVWWNSLSHEKQEAILGRLWKLDGLL